MKRRCCDGFKKPRFDRDVLAITKQRWFSSSSNKCGRKTKKNPGYARNWESERNRRSSFWKYRHRYSGTWYRENHRSKEEKNTTACEERSWESKEERTHIIQISPSDLPSNQQRKGKQTNRPLRPKESERGEENRWSTLARLSSLIAFIHKCFSENVPKHIMRCPEKTRLDR